MRRVYLYNHRKLNDTIFISDEPAHYLKNVLRMNIGSRFYGFDGTGTEYELEIKELDSNIIKAKILTERTTLQKETSISIELCISLCKTKTFESILKKVSELGISRIVPIKSERSIVEISSKKAEEKIQRWNKIAADGSKIAGRTKVPEILLPQKFKDAVSQKTGGILFWEQSKTSLNSIINKILSNAVDTKVLKVFIGPEGGFTEKEINLAIENNISVASLGPRILSVETATISAISILSYEIENFLKSQGS